MRSTGRFMTGVFIGGVLGFAASLMVAPESGEEMRQRVKRGAGQVLDEVRAEAEEVAVHLKQRAGHVVDQTREVLDRSSSIMEEMEKKLEQADDKLARLHEQLEESDEDST